MVCRDYWNAASALWLRISDGVQHTLANQFLIGRLANNPIFYPVALGVAFVLMPITRGVIRDFEAEQLQPSLP